MSGPVYVMGGNPVQPGDATYSAYFNWTGILELSWPFSFTSTGNPLRTTMNFSTTDNPGLVQLPDATEASPGQSFIMINSGNTNITVSTNDGSNLFTMTAQLNYWVVLTDNTTQAGSWYFLNYGSGASGGTAASLAGYGLVAQPNSPNPDTLNVDFPTSAQTANFTLALSNWGQLLLLGGTCTEVTLPPVGNVDGYFCYLYNNTGAPITLTGNPPGVLINGSGTLLLLPGLSCMLQFDGNLNYTTIGLDTNAGTISSLVTIPLTPGQPFYNLSASDLANEIIVFTTSGSPLTGDITIYFGLDDNEWTVHNQTGSTFNFLLSAGSNSNPQGVSVNLIDNNVTQFYVNSTTQNIYSISPFSDVPNQLSYIPVSNTSGGTPGTVSWVPSVVTLANDFTAMNDPITLSSATPTSFISTLLSRSNIQGYILIEGIVFVSPSSAPNIITTLTIQKTIDGGSPTNTYYQGATPLYQVKGNSLYRDSDLLPIPIHVLDYIENSSNNIAYHILGAVTVTGTSTINVSIDGTSATGVSYLNVSWFNGLAYI